MTLTKTKSEFRIIAHRGFADQYPENTLKAFTNATDHSDMVEVDVRRCGSGELVVFHDEKLDRVTDSSGRVYCKDYRTLEKVDVLGTGEGIPRLRNVLESLPEDTGVNLELKQEGIASDALRILEEYDNDLLVSSFSDESLREVREFYPGVDTAYIFAMNPHNSFETALELGCDYVHPAYPLCITSDLVESAHDHGIEVNTWTVKTRKAVNKLAERGVDGIIADRYDIF